MLDNEQWLKNHGLNWTAPVKDFGTLKLTEDISFRVSQGSAPFSVSVYYKCLGSEGQLMFKSEQACKGYLEHKISFKTELDKLVKTIRALDRRIDPLVRKRSVADATVNSIILTGR